GGDRLEDVDRLKGEVALVGAGREHDAVITDLDFANVVHADAIARLDFLDADATRRIGDVDGVLADALAELAQAARRAARTDDGGLELGESLAEFLGDDAGERQDGGRTGDLDNVARLGRSSAKRGGESERCGGDDE